MDKLAAYSFVRHAPGWLGEYDAALVDPNRRLLHVVFTAIVEENGHPTARVYWTSTKLE